MPLLDSALAFAITMLALSLACSAIVELIHRIFSMRQAGFKYMLEQMFDQVLSRYVEPAIKAKVDADTGIVGQAAKDARVKQLFDAAKKAFVERMRANRAPMGVTPNATPVDDATKVAENKPVRVGVWGGRELTELSPIGFMERLGTMDLGATIVDGMDKTAVSSDAALKDIAQKFEALGKDAADYFEGRARLLSVVVAVVFAFVVHADAVDLYTTFLRNPNTTASVIAQSEAIQKQFTAAQIATEAADKAKAAADTKKLADGKPPENAPQPVTPDNGQKQVDDAKAAAKAAKEGAEKMVKQFADLGVPLGWTDERYAAADLLVVLWSCKEMPADSWLPWLTVLRTCKPDDNKPDDKKTGATATNGNTNPAPAKDGDKGAPATATAAKDGAAPKKVTNLQYTNVWFGIPLNLGVLFYLVLGGLLIGLGAPFWFNVVTTITNLRSGGSGATGAASGSSISPATMAMAVSSQRAQPVTPVSAFLVASDARPSDGTKTAASSP
jgi:hypothetical protein